MDKETFKNEEWKDIQGYEGLYKVSNYGRLMSLDRTVYNGHNKTYSKISGQMLKINFNNKRYASIGLRKNGKVKYFLVHRLVAFAFVDNPNNKSDVNHIDGNTHNNYYKNLEWCTKSENSKHAYQHNLKGCADSYIRNLEKLHEKQMYVLIIAKKDGNEYRYSSVSEMSKMTGIKRTSILAALNKGNTVKGYAVKGFKKCDIANGEPLP